MSLPPPLPVASPAPRRSKVITVLGWLVIAGCGLLIPISVISQIMILVGSYGTNTSDPLGWLTVVATPPVTLVAGIGLLRRWRWAWAYLLLLCAIVLFVNVKGILKGPTPAYTYVSPTGVPTTVLASDANYSVVAMALSLGVAFVLVTKTARVEFFGETAANA